MLFDKMILGNGIEMNTDSQATGINSNVLVCAGSGSGKTMSIIEPRILEAKNSSFLITVTKRRIIDQYTPLFKKRGYEVLDLNLAFPQKTSCSMDFLQYINSETDIKHLAESIVMSDSRKRKSTSADPYWDMMAVSLLTAEIYFVITRDVHATFKDVLELNDELCCLPRKIQKIDKQNTKNKPPKVRKSAAALLNKWHCKAKYLS